MIYPTMKRKPIGGLDYDHVGHFLYHLRAHVFLSTEFPKFFCDAEIRAFVIQRLRQVAQEQNCEVTEVSADADYLHFLLRYPPTVALSAIVLLLKDETSSSVLKASGPLVYNTHTNLWSGGYLLASIGGAPLAELQKHFTDKSGSN